MLDNIKINFDFERLSWYVSISILSFIFTVISMLYRPEYIHYGLVTFAYGVIAQITDLAFQNIFNVKAKLEEKKHKDIPWWILFTLEFAFIIIWLICLTPVCK